MIELNEQDLAAVMKIQEAKGTTIARAKEFYRLKIKQLANPDAPDRAEIILENFQRTAEAKTEKEIKPKAAKKAAKKAAEKPAVDEFDDKPEVAIPSLNREVKLKPTDRGAHIYTANLFGRKHAVLLAAADYDVKNPEKFRFNPLHMSESRMDRVKKLAKEMDAPYAVCISVAFKGEQEQGYAVPEELVKKFSGKMSRGRIALSLSAEARRAYADGGWTGVKFSEAAEEKAAA